MKYSFFSILAIISFFSYGQVGIGTLSPNNEFEIQGDIILRSLSHQDPQKYNRTVMLDDNGVLGAVPASIDGFNFAGVGSAFMPKSIAFNQEEDLDLDLKVGITLTKESSNLLVITYNIPVYIQSDKDDPVIKTGYVGIKLFRRNGDGSESEIVGGDRKISFSSEYNLEPVKSLFIEGKWIDVHENTQNTDQSVTYFLVGFVEGYAQETVHFSVDQNSSVPLKGIGGLSVKIFNKAI